MNEAKLTTKLRPKLLKWAKETIVAEVKYVKKGAKFYYSSGSFPKQIENLKIVNNSKLIWKHPDTGWGTPWDLSVYVKTPAYLVVFYDKDFYVISIKKILKEKSKSLTEERANQIACYKDKVL